VVREINRINEAELNLGTDTASWHDDYKDSAYIFIGGLNYDLTEGDVITIFSQCVYPILFTGLAAKSLHLGMVR
jgi:RNA-binding motif X-linked protein 2